LWRGGEKQAAVLTEGFREGLAYDAPLGRIDYIACVDRGTLEPLEIAGPEGLLATAVFFGTTRLIDNLELAP
jgi:pantoate--beta-alanine ligase